MFGQRAFDRQVADDVSADDDEVAGYEMLTVEITHDISDRRRIGLEEGQLLERRGQSSPFRRAGCI